MKVIMLEKRTWMTFHPKQESEDDPHFGDSFSNSCINEVASIVTKHIEFGTLLKDKQQKKKSSSRLTSSNYVVPLDEVPTMPVDS